MCCALVNAWNQTIVPMATPKRCPGVERGPIHVKAAAAAREGAEGHSCGPRGACAISLYLLVNTLGEHRIISPSCSYSSICHLFESRCVLFVSDQTSEREVVKQRDELTKVGKETISQIRVSFAQMFVAFTTPNHHHPTPHRHIHILFFYRFYSECR